MSANFSRRQLFKLRLGDVGNLVRQARQSLTEEASPNESSIETQAEPTIETTIIRPPGALADETEFLTACERCNACVEACPYDGVIETFSSSHGKLEGSPFLTPDVSPCRWCFDFPCINACPSEALQLPDEDEDDKKSLSPIAKSVIDLDTCLNAQGTICDTCSVMCPPHVKAIKMINRQPQLDTDLCTGCGMCAYYCESEPGSIAIVALKE